MRTRILLLSALLLSAFLTDASAQTRDDSLAIVSAQWEVKEAGKGLKSWCASFEALYQGPQYVSVVEVGRKGKHRAGIGFSRQMTPLSQLAREHKAKAAFPTSSISTKPNNPKTVIRIIRHGLHGFTLFLCRKSVFIRVIRG